MLTGDKIETAINIGVATSMLDPNKPCRIYSWESLEAEASCNSWESDSKRTKKQLISTA